MHVVIGLHTVVMYLTGALVAWNGSVSFPDLERKPI